jgi:hypothetical protein
MKERDCEKSEKAQQSKEERNHNAEMSILLYGTTIKRSSDGYVLSPEEVRSLQVGERY